MPLPIYDKATSRSLENTIMTHQCLSGGIAFSALLCSFIVTLSFVLSNDFDFTS